MSLGRKIPASESLARLAAQPTKENSTPAPDGVLQKLATRFEPRPPKFRMDDLVLPEAVLHEISILKSRIRNHDLIYREWGFDKIDPMGINVAVNFYGLPGTGKTMCAEALASELGQLILEVNYAEIESKYVGDTPKNIVASFQAAKDANAILFFDEADSILGRRLTNVTQSADHGVNVSRAVMLKQLDDFGGIVIFATNLARNFDSAFVRRILQHVYVQAPDEGCRLRLWQKMVTPSVPGRSIIDFQALARQSDGLTGGLIKNAVLLALSELANMPPAKRVLSDDAINRAMASVKRGQKEVGIRAAVFEEAELPDLHPDIRDDGRASATIDKKD
jgi:SpoVK/Ycf46/Vps4 family AAA+-type ATPase